MASTPAAGEATVVTTNTRSNSTIGGLTSELVRKYALSGPRYTSYPTADRFHEHFDPQVHAAWLRRRRSDAPLSLYLHIPFCESLCYYCACNKIVTKDRRRASTYVDYLIDEIDLHLEHLARRTNVTQLHWGGGTPTYLSDADMTRLMTALRERFNFASEGEYSIEIDPRTVSGERIAFLRTLGFNRMSLGVQDFDPDVQQAVHRVQPAALVDAAIDSARANGFRSINFDLIYGLPRQSVASLARTMERVVTTGVDRIALYNYAHLPVRFKPQRRIDPADCPDADARIEMFRLALDKLTDAGYVYIGLDHFAKPDDALAQALHGGNLQRNFQGYSTAAEVDLLALGVSGISKLGAMYSQNVRTLEAYYHRIDAGMLPVARGIELTADDLRRRAIVMALMCRGTLSIPAFEREYGVRFASEFAAERARLVPLAQAGLVTVTDDSIEVTAAGRLLLRAVAMAFDGYLQGAATQATYSKVV